MKNKLFTLISILWIGLLGGKAQDVCFTSPFTVTSSVIDVNGNQKHTVDVQISNSSIVPLTYLITGFNGQVLQTIPSVINPGETIDNSFDILLNNELTEAIVYIQIVSPSGYNNGTCSNNVSFPLPPVPVCLELYSATLLNCYVDNDGIGLDGDVHVYQIQAINNDIGPIEFKYAGNQDLLVDYHPSEHILPGQIKTITYLIYSQPGVSATGELFFTFESQNFTFGCDYPVSVTFQPCEIPVCLEFGSVTHDGCTINNDGTVSHTYNAQVINTSNLPLQYTIIPTSGGNILGATSLIIPPNVTELIAFDYITMPSDRMFSFYIETETVGVNNGCEEIINVSLPDCSTQTTTGELSLLAFFDRNNNGQVDQGENGLSGIEFTVRNMASGADYHVTTNTLGQASLSGLDPELYLVNQTVNLPWQVNPSGGSLNNVLVEVGKTTTLEFANYHPNAGIQPIKIHNLDAVCIAEQGTGSHVYKIYGQLSTSFEDESMLSVRDLQNQTAANLSIGPVQALASYVPFSFDYASTQDSVDLVFFLTTSDTAARDTFRVALPACCGVGNGFTNDTISPCEIVDISFGAFIPAGGIRIAEVVVSHFQSCTKKIGISTDQNILLNMVGSIDGSEITALNNEFEIPQGSRQLKFYLDVATGNGQIKITSIGCQDSCVHTLNVAPNYNNNVNMVDITQTDPGFSNIYGASIQLNNLTNNAKPKFVSFGFDDATTIQTKMMGVTAANYFYFKGREELLPLENVKNDYKQIHLTLDENVNCDGLKCNFFFSGPKKDVDVYYSIYAENGQLLGKGVIQLDPDKVVSKIEDADFAEDAISIYPNPVSEKINIVVKGEIGISGMQYHITNIDGKTCTFGTINQQEQGVNINNLPSGQYIMHTTDRNGQTTQNKFLKID
jgi:hypothetical protein